MRVPLVLSSAAVLAASTTGCLITDSPQFQVPQHTAPFLVAASASPDTRGIVRVDTSALTSEPFSADVVSQDDPAGSGGQFQQVSSRLYIDYGFNEVPGLPFRYVLSGNTLQPGTLDQTSGRRVSVTWYPQVDTVTAGCHTATLVVSHLFDDVPGCWACNDDFSTLTWWVNACDSSMGTCTDLPVMGATGCPDPATLTSCETVLADAGSTCPEAADAGAP